MCSQEVDYLEKQAMNCPDTVKMTSAAESALRTDLGGAVQHTYFTHRRAANASDNFKFNETFPARVSA